MTDTIFPPRASIKNTDPDFDQFWVKISGSPIANVLSADIAKREVWVHDGADHTKAHELKTGSVSIVPKSPAQPAPPASAGRKSRSRRSTSGE